MIWPFVLALLGMLAAPFIGGFISGVDRKLTARFQSRKGPSIFQAFYDVAKLFGKETVISHRLQPLCIYIYLASAALSVGLFFAQSDLLLIFFIQAAGAVFLVIGAYLVPSPYSQIGANRELFQILAYEPLVIIVIAGISLVTGSFKISDVYAYETPLLMKLPLLFIVLGYALTIKLKKSPFDISGSHHAHQEIVKGVYTEYSGSLLALIEIAHFYETVLILGLCSLFWSTGVIGFALLLFLTYLLEIIVDNISARLTFRWMLGSVLITGVTLSSINLIWLYAA